MAADPAAVAGAARESGLAISYDALGAAPVGDTARSGRSYSHRPRHREIGPNWTSWPAGDGRQRRGRASRSGKGRERFGREQLIRG